MAEADVLIPEDESAGDEEMVEVVEVQNGENEQPTGLEDVEPTLPERVSFLE